MGSVFLSDAREDTFEDKKMLFSMLSASLVVLTAGSVLPEERISCSFPPGTCMAWTWSSVSGCKCNNELNDVAQEWADYLMAVDGFEHRHPNKYGENIYMSRGRAAQEQAQGAVDSWYSEIKDYTFGREPSRGG